jgi:hypothetical protein
VRDVPPRWGRLGGGCRQARGSREGRGHVVLATNVTQCGAQGRQEAQLDLGVKTHWKTKKIDN